MREADAPLPVTPRASWRFTLAWLAVGATVFTAPAITSLARKSATFDEPVYVVAGLSYLTLGDFAMKDDAPPLVAYLAGVSPWVHGLRIPGGQLGFDDGLYREYPFATRLLYRSGLDADEILFWSRLAVLLPFGLLLLTTVLLWSTALFGRRAGVFALLLTALSPNLLAHGRLVAADFPCAATMLFASFLMWRTTAKPGAARALAAGAALGLALVTKFTALLLLPCFAIVLVVAAWRRELAPREALTTAALVAAPAAGLVALSYGIPPDPMRYFSGVSAIYRNIDPNFQWYLFGSLHPPGVPHYYLATLAVKASAPLLALGIGSLFFMRRRGAGLLAELCLLLPALLLLLASTQDGFSAGVRRLLPLFPVLAISGSRFLAPSVGARASAWLAAAAVLLLWHATSSLSSWPHYIPYFNELAGGREAGPDLLDDANVDFGQDLKALPAVLERHGIDDLVLGYFGSADPAFYGIRHRPLTEKLLRAPEPGVYAVSLHLLIRLRQGPGSPLLGLTPFDRAGTSIWLLRVEEPAGSGRGAYNRQETTSLETTR